MCHILMSATNVTLISDILATPLGLDLSGHQGPLTGGSVQLMIQNSPYMYSGTVMSYVMLFLD